MDEEPPDILAFLRPDETVSGGRNVPATWLEREISALPIPREVVDACRSMLDEGESNHELGMRRFRAEIDGRERGIAFVAADVIPVRRSIVPVRPLLTRVVDTFAPQAQLSEVEFSISQAPDLPPAIHGDEEKLVWMLSTLVGNAIRLVRKSAGRAGHVELDASIDSAGKGVVLRISDDGPGMPEGVARWLFERDPRTGRAIGVALLMVKDVVSAHRGTISVESALGEGSVFTVRLPRYAPGRQARRAAHC